jgi:hypothetical protein
MTEETATAIALRLIRNEIIMECAKVCSELRRKDYSAETKDWIAGTWDCALALHALVTGSHDAT